MGGLPIVRHDRQANGSMFKSVVIVIALGLGKFSHGLLDVASCFVAKVFDLLAQLKLHSTDLGHVASEHEKHVDFIVELLKHSQLELAPVFQDELLLAVQLRTRSEEHTSELQSLMRISYAVFCLKNKKQTHHFYHPHPPTQPPNSRSEH